MSRRERNLLSLAALALPLLLTGVAFASGGGGHGDGHAEGHTSGQWLTLLFTIINFGIYAAVLLKVTKNPLRDFLSGRRKEVVEAMSSAARAKDEAERVKAEYQAKAAALEETTRQLADEMIEVARRDHERMLASAKETGERLLAEADRTAESDLNRARRELRQEAARLAGELASRQISEQLDAGRQSRLVGEFIEGVRAS